MIIADILRYNFLKIWLKWNIKNISSYNFNQTFTNKLNFGIK